MKNKIITKRKNNIVILFVCLIFIFQAFPIVGCTSSNTDNGSGGGTTGLLSTEDTTEEYSELETPIEVETSGLETPTEAESTELYTPIVTESSEPESSTATEPVETEPQYRSPILDTYKDMSVMEIYESVLNDDWVVTTEGGYKSVKIELWDTFLSVVQQGETSIVRIAELTIWDDLASLVKEYDTPSNYPQISLTELYYDGEMYHLTSIFVESDSSSVSYCHSLPYLLLYEPITYYIGEYPNTQHPGSSFSSPGRSYYVFIDKSKLD